MSHTLCLEGTVVMRILSGCWHGGKEAKHCACTTKYNYIHFKMSTTIDVMNVLQTEKMFLKEVNTAWPFCGQPKQKPCYASCSSHTALGSSAGTQAGDYYI
jgi:hypothetical protein